MMFKSVKIYFGSDKYFNQKLEENQVGIDNSTKFTDILYETNRNIEEKQTISFACKENIVVGGDEFGSGQNHTISNFINIIRQNSEVNKINLYLHNPPNLILQKFPENKDKNVEHFPYKYQTLTESHIKTLYTDLNKKIYGQSEPIREILRSLIPLTRNHKKPVTILLYGDSGIGKTETVKVISESLEGKDTKLFRKQLSMFQNEHFANYLFGSSHSSHSFSKELLGRETNVILLDEFDKVSNVYFNAFYELFDEGVFTDTNYTVNLEDTIIFCTSNYQSESDVKKHLGEPIFSRFSKIIKFNTLSEEIKNQIIGEIFIEEFDKLSDKQKNFWLIGENQKTLLEEMQKSIKEVNFRTIRNKVKDIFNEVILEDILT